MIDEIQGIHFTHKQQWKEIANGHTIEFHISIQETCVCDAILLLTL